MMQDWTPSRDNAHMVINVDLQMMCFHNKTMYYVDFQFDIKEHAQPMRNAWKLITSDMRRSKMSIWFTVNEIDYEFYYDVGYRIKQRYKKKEDSLLIGGRPMTLHHVVYCIKNWCGLKDATKVTPLSQREINAWNKASWGQYE